MRNSYHLKNYAEIKERVYLCNIELPKHGIVIYNFGNVSMVDRDEEIIAIKPSGVMYDVMQPDDIVIVDFAGNIIDGKLRPSSDTMTHLELYKNFPQIGGVVHTHSTYAVAWAQAAKPVPIYGTTHADHLHEEIPVTDFMTEEMIKGNYEIATGQQIVNTFKNLDPNEIQMVLVAGHGPFTWGDNPEKALYNSVILEELAKMALLTQSINPNTPCLQQALIDKHYNRKHGKNAYYGQK